MMIRSLLALGLLAHIPLAAQVELAPKGEGWSAQAKTYSARIAKDGCLTHLEVGGRQFLAPGVGISRGSYFYQAGPLRLPAVERRGDNALEARGEKATVRYEFHPGHMRWAVENLTKERMSFFLVLAANVRSACTAGGEWHKAPLEANWGECTFYSDAARLELAGSDRLWGPWEGAHQVWEIQLDGGAKREMSLKPGAASAAERAQLIALHRAPPQPDLVLHSPRPWQVFQRQTLAAGPILLSGRVLAEAETLEARIAGPSRAGAIDTDWFELPMIAPTRAFNVQRPLPAGGWYRLELRARKGDAIVASALVERFGVGEVFVGAGQSNSTNCGQFKIKQSSGMVSSFSGAHWQLADDPQPGPHDRSKGGSFWPAFGDAMHTRYGVPIGVAVTGHGGTSVDRWQPGGDLFTWTMTRIHQLGPLGFRALLWHQGESDVSKSAEEYYEKFKTVILASKVAAGWEFPWFVAQVSYHNPQKLSFPTTRAAQKRLWAEGIALEGPDTDTLTGDTRDFGGKGIHFSPKGLKVHGEMWAEKVAIYLDRVLQR